MGHSGGGNISNFGGANKKKSIDFNLKPLKSTKSTCPTRLACLLLIVVRMSHYESLSRMNRHIAIYCYKNK